MNSKKQVIMRGLITLLLAFHHACLFAADNASFYLRDGDTVVFYGDSITEQNLYTQAIELYTVTRFPEMRIHFFNAGVGGDRVTGGGAGDIETRLGRDVIGHKPSVVTIMLGMNDGSYKPLDRENEDSYKRGYEAILTSLHDKLPGVRLTSLGPSAFDEVTRAPIFASGYNHVLQQLSALDENLAHRHGDMYADLNAPVQSALERANRTNPVAARLLIPDRIHPEWILHWVMAEAVLSAWNAPSLVTSVSIDAKHARIIDAMRAHVDSVLAHRNGIMWNELDEALPLPFDMLDLPFATPNEKDTFLARISDVQERLNQEPLRVTGLARGMYVLQIDQDSIGQFSQEALERGINLAKYNTPMRWQARRIGWMIRDRDAADFVRMRICTLNKGTGTSESLQDPSLTEFIGRVESQIHANAQPSVHRFSLTRVSA